jgi:hypothetical protein
MHSERHCLQNGKIIHWLHDEIILYKHISNKIFHPITKEYIKFNSKPKISIMYLKYE